MLVYSRTDFPPVALGCSWCCFTHPPMTRGCGGSRSAADHRRDRKCRTDVPKAVRLVVTQRGPRELCEAHARVAEGGGSWDTLRTRWGLSAAEIAAGVGEEEPLCRNGALPEVPFCDDPAGPVHDPAVSPLFSV